MCNWLYLPANLFILINIWLEIIVSNQWSLYISEQITTCCIQWVTAIENEQLPVWLLPSHTMKSNNEELRVKEIKINLYILSSHAFTVGGRWKWKFTEYLNLFKTDPLSDSLSFCCLGAESVLSVFQSKNKNPLGTPLFLFLNTGGIHGTLSWR